MKTRCGIAGRRRKAQRGFSLIVMAVSSTLAIAVLGLIFDLGRACIIKDELQAYADAASLAAALELDGTPQGLGRADGIVATGPAGGGARNRYDFDTKSVSNVTAAYSATFNGAYQPAGSAPLNSRFVQVTAAASAPLFFLPILPGIGNALVVSATSIAGQAVQSSIGEGAAPFSPDAHNVSDPNFGFVAGQQYTLKWPPPSKRGQPGYTCSGDGSFLPPNSPADRGYIDVGQGGGNSGLHDAIVNNQDFLPQPYTAGSTINWVTGNKNVSPGIDERFNQDTDTTSTTYGSYTGNGRRILIVPVNNDADPALVVGFAAFFMPPNMCGSKNTDPCCAEYIGAGVLGSSRKGPGAGGAGLYAVKLFR